MTLASFKNSTTLIDQEIFLIFLQIPAGNHNRIIPT